MDKINEILKRSKFNNILSYLLYGSDSVKNFSKNYDLEIQESYSTFLDSLEEMYLDVDRNDKHLRSSIKTFAQIHEDIYFEIGLRVGIHLSKEWELASSQSIQEKTQKTDEKSILSTIAELRMGTTLEEKLRKDTEYQKTNESVRETIKKLDYIGLDHNQWDAVDKALSASNEKSYDYGKNAYCCGFKDAMHLLKRE